MPSERHRLSEPASVYSALMSPYLSRSYKEDELRLDQVLLEVDMIEGIHSVPQYFMPTDGRFHLTLPLVFVAVAQLAIIYAHVDNGLTKKELDVYVREVSFKCKRTVRKTSDISIALRLLGRRHVQQGVFYQGSIDVDRGSFVGRGSFLLRYQAAP